MKILLVFLLTVISLTSFAKRMAPAVINPISKDGNEFSFFINHKPCKRCVMTVFLVSKNLKSGKANWQRQLYQKQYNDKMETDVQDIFPKSLTFGDKTEIIITDEKGSTFKVDSKSGKLIEPTKPKIYKPS